MPGADLIAWAEEIERLGFEILWYRDHVLWHSPVLDPFTILGAFAVRTSRIRLGPGVLLVPLRPPAVVAKAVASLDYLSSGRAVLGVGIGGEFPKEFDACGVPITERGRRMDEAIEVMKVLWTGAPATYKGAFYQVETAVMEPPPIQRPHPPIWVGGRSDAAVARAGKLGDGWLAHFVTPEGFSKRLEKAVEYWRRRGRSVESFRTGLVLYLRIAPTYEEARREATSYLEREYRQSFEHLVDKYCALGPVSECIATIDQYVQAGARHVTVIPACQPSMMMDQLRQVAAEIVPRYGQSSEC